MQTSLPFFGSQKKKENEAPKSTAVSAQRIKTVWDRLHNVNNITDLYNFQAQYGKLPEKISQINQDQALQLNMWANVNEDDFMVGYKDGDMDTLDDANPKVVNKLKSKPNVTYIKNIDSMATIKSQDESVGKGLYKRYTELREDAFLMDYIDRYKEEAKNLLKEAGEEPPTTKHPPPPQLALTLKKLGLSGSTIDAVKVVQANIPTYKVILINGEGFYLKHYNENDPFIATIGVKEYNIQDLIGDFNMAKDAIYDLLTKDQFQGLGGDEEGGEGGDDFGGDEPPVDEPAEEPEA
jgi:hypothetical protein